LTVSTPIGPACRATFQTLSAEELQLIEGGFSLKKIGRAIGNAAKKVVDKVDELNQKTFWYRKAIFPVFPYIP
jgi:bacteriocin-like protein